MALRDIVIRNVLRRFRNFAVSYERAIGALMAEGLTDDEARDLLVRSR